MSHRRIREGRRLDSAGTPRRASGALGVLAAGTAVLALGIAPMLGAPPARADVDALFDPIVDAIGQAATVVDSDPTAGLDPGLDLGSDLGPTLDAAVDAASIAGPLAAADAQLTDWFQTFVFDPVQQLEQLWLASPLGQLLNPLLGWPFNAVDAGPHSAASTWLFGDSVTGSTGASVPSAAAATDLASPAATSGALETASVPLRMQVVTEPVVDLSVNGGPQVPVLVDTGSSGLVLPIWDVGLQNLSFPTSFGLSSYSGGLNYFYVTMPARVDFGPDIATGTDVITDPTSVNVALFAFPNSFSALGMFGGTWQSFFAPAGVDGVLGIGPNAVGPTPGLIPTADLPGALGQGVLIDQANGVLQFGPNPLTDGTAVSGMPNAPLAVSINGGPLLHNVPALIDSGGVWGTMPTGVLGGGVAGSYAPAGTDIAVYTNDGQTLLYSYTVTGPNAPLLTGMSAMNTGNAPFAQQPVYVSYAGSGTAIFGGVTP